MAKTIVVTIDNHGNPAIIDAMGFTGTQCMEATEPIIRSLGKGKSVDKVDLYTENAIMESTQLNSGNV